jgi:hypothetical protein
MMSGKTNQVVHPTSLGYLARIVGAAIVYYQGLNAVDPLDMTRQFSQGLRKGLGLVQARDLDDQFGHRRTLPEFQIAQIQNLISG